MKQLVCEMCNSTDLLKQDGVFVCQNCGTKYTVEEARKMMMDEGDVVGGAANVTGTAKSAQSEELQNLYAVARRAKDDNNSESAAKYYDMILVKDPMSWEASFYTVYYSAMQTNIANIQSAAIKVNNCIDTVMGLIHDNVADEGDQLVAVTEVVAKVIVIANMLANAAENHYTGISSDIKSNYTQEYLNRVAACKSLLYNTGDQVEFFFGDKKAFGIVATLAWKAGINRHKSYLSMLANIPLNEKEISNYADKISKYDEEYGKSLKRESLQKRISAIDNQIKNTPLEAHYKVGCLTGFFGIVGIIMLILGIALAGMGSSAAAWAIPVAIVELIIAIAAYVKSKPSEATIKANIATVESLKKERDQLYEELNDLVD